MLCRDPCTGRGNASALVRFNVAAVTLRPGQIARSPVRSKRIEESRTVDSDRRRSADISHADRRTVRAIDRIGDPLEQIE